LKTRIALLSLLTIACLVLAVAPAMADTYTNGPINGTADGWTINFGYSVSDSFTLASNDTAVTAFHFNYWDANPSDLLTTADLAIGTTSFGGTINPGVAFTSTFISTNQFGYGLYQADATGLSIPWVGGAGYATLSNACSTSGCSVSNPIYWDENSGGSTAYQDTLGSIPSESFTISGTAGGTVPPPGTPEPSSIMLFGSGILGLAGVLRRKLTR